MDALGNDVGVDLLCRATAPLIAMPVIPDCSATTLSTKETSSATTAVRVGVSRSWEKLDMRLILLKLQGSGVGAFERSWAVISQRKESLSSISM